MTLARFRTPYKPPEVLRRPVDDVLVVPRPSLQQLEKGNALTLNVLKARSPGSNEPVLVTYDSPPKD